MGSPLGAARAFICRGRVPSNSAEPCGVEQQTHCHQKCVCGCSRGQPPVVSSPRTMQEVRLTFHSGLFPYWVWVVLSNRPMFRLVFQHIQILVQIHSPRDWPVAIWRRKLRRKASASRDDEREQAQQDFPGTHVEEGESTRNLVPSHTP